MISGRYFPVVDQCDQNVDVLITYFCSHCWLVVAINTYSRTQVISSLCEWIQETKNGRNVPKPITIEAKEIVPPNFTKPKKNLIQTYHCTTPQIHGHSSSSRDHFVEEYHSNGSSSSSSCRVGPSMMILS